MRDVADLGAGTGGGRPVGEPAEHHQPAERAAVLGHAALGVGAERTGRGRHVDIDRVRKLRYRRQDTDHRVRLGVHFEHLADDIRVASEGALPVVVGEHQHRIRIEVVLAVDERATVQRGNSERVEVIVRHDAGLHALGFAAPEQDEEHVVEFHQLLDAGGLVAIVIQLGNRCLDDAAVCDLRLQEHQPLAVVIGKRTQQYAVDDAEDGGVGTDAERQREDRRSGERPVLAQRSQRVADILHQHIEVASLSFITALFLVLLDCAEADSSTPFSLILVATLLEVLLGFHLEMERDLHIELAVGDRPAVAAQAQQPALPTIGGHGSISRRFAGCLRRPTRAVPSSPFQRRAAFDPWQSSCSTSRVGCSATFPTRRR